jgi:hypothetical protein
MPAPPDAAKMVPNVAGKGAKLVLDVKPPASSQSPSSAVLSIARGFRFDRRARKQRCSDEQAANFNCPEASRVGRGTADVTATGPIFPGGSQKYVAKIDVFLTHPQQRGDIAGFVVQVSESTTGVRGSGRARLVRHRSGPYGSQLRFDSIPASPSLPPGFSVRVDRIQVRLGASRRIRVRRRVHGRTRRVRKRVYLIRNPRTCSGSWPYALHVAYSDGHSEDYVGGVTCRKRR